MSTKIHNGHASNLPLHDLMTKVSRHLDTWAQVQKRCVKQIVAKEITRRVDDHCLKLTTPPNPNIWDETTRAIQSLWWTHMNPYARNQDLDKILTGPESFWDLQFLQDCESTKTDFVFIPNPLNTGPKTLMCLFGNHKTLNTTILDDLKTHTRPWPYWDNTDPDESVSQEEWVLRKKVWDAAFKSPLGKPGQRLVLSVNPRWIVMGRPNLDDDSLWPTRQERALAIAKEQLRGEHLKNEAEKLNTTPAGLGGGKITEILMSFDITEKALQNRVKTIVNTLVDRQPQS